MNQNHTDITIVLDRSGSMHGIAGDTIVGFNRFLRAQQDAPGTAALTLHQFDHEFQTPVNAEDVKLAPSLNPQNYVPRGNTALLDAIGRAINSTGARLAAMPEGERAGKVVFVIITDGHENASHEFTNARIQEMITHQRDAYKWEFVFLGATADAFAVGTQYGAAAANVMRYAQNAKGVSASYDALSSNVRAMRSGDAVCMAFSDEQKAAQVEAGAE